VLYNVVSSFCAEKSLIASFTKKEAIEYLRWRIGFDDKWCKKALTVIFSRQTVEEQNTDQTILYNKMGFTGRDANFLSSIYKNMKQYNGHLTSRQLDVLKRIMPKYSRQIYSVCDPEKLERIIDNDEDWQKTKGN